MNKTNRVVLSLVLTGVVSLVAITGIGSSRVDAANSSNVNFSVSLESSANVTIPQSITPLNITPSSSGAFGVADVSLTAYTNSSAGYKVTMTTKDSTNTANTNLVNADDSTKTIPTLETLSGGYVTTYSGSTPPANLFPANRWGVAVDSGNYFPASENQLLKETDAASGASGSAMTVHLGTKVDLLTTTGTYNTTVVIAVTANFDGIYMQDLTNQQCSTLADSDPLVVYDRRDGSDYTVRYINGACWMTQNLRITGTISATDSNFTGSDFNTKAADLKGSSSSYTQAQSHVADSDDVSASSSASDGPYTINQLGAWYNYCAASAGQVCSETQANATQDICPKNWHLPPNGTSTGQTDSITSYASSFNPIYGGHWYNGSLYSATTYGRWWSATANGSSLQYRLRYSSGSLSTNSDEKSLGFYIRCVRTS